MDLQKLLDYLIANLPLIILFLATIGALKAANGALHLLTSKIKQHVLKTPNKLDDALVLPIVEKIEKVGDDLEDGRIDGAAAAAKVRMLAKQLRPAGK
jgi:hypothetical protein